MQLAITLVNDLVLKAAWQRDHSWLLGILLQKLLAGCIRCGDEASARQRQHEAQHGLVDDVEARKGAFFGKLVLLSGPH